MAMACVDGSRIARGLWWSGMLVGCSLVSGLFARSRPLAAMVSANEVPFCFAGCDASTFGGLSSFPV